ncbi:MAG: 30S ribosome-binding factor RbfA [Deltaproteobacteria bacterium]|nr:30S ribosome-binding factor RbfA [Deltaproteobacteria bacterium]
MRCRRVADSLKKEISSMLLLEVKDPRIAFVTIIDVAVSPDLRLAEIYYTVHGSALDRENTQAGLRSSSGFMRRELGRRLHLKRIPELDFRYDQSVDHGFRIDQLLDELSGS